MNALTLVREARAGVAAMPVLMRMLCGGAMLACPLLLFVFPLSPHVRVNGELFSRDELWRSGAELVFISFLLLGTIASWGLALRRLAARWVAVATPVVPTLVAQVLPPSKIAMSIQEGQTVVNTCITAGVLYVCLFHIPAVKRYFAWRPGANGGA